MALSLGANNAPVTVPDNTGLVLTKGERINLSKAGLEEVLIGVSWAGGSDLDVSAILLGADDKFVAPVSQHIVFHANLSAENGAVQHSGDARDGDGVPDGADDETIRINLAALKPEITAVAVIVSSHSEVNGTHGAPKRFGTVAKPVARLYDKAGKELNKFELDEDASTATCVYFVRLYRKDGEWRFEAKGEKLGELGIGLQCAVDKFTAR